MPFASSRRILMSLIATALFACSDDTSSPSPAAESDMGGQDVAQDFEGRDSTSDASIDPDGEMGSTNGAPAAANDLAVIPERTSVEIDVLANDSDPDGDSLSIVSVTMPTQGVATISGGSITYRPRLQFVPFVGDDRFEYTISDGELEATASVQVSIVHVNDPPRVELDAVGTAPETAVEIQPLANDSDDEDDELTLVSVSTPENGSATTNADTVTYTPDAGFTGFDFIDYTVSDGNSEADGTIVVQVGAGWMAMGGSDFTDDWTQFADWSSDAGIGVTPASNVFGPSVHIDSTGRLGVAYSSGRNLHFARLEGNSWTGFADSYLGGGFDGGGGSVNVPVALFDANDNPVLSWDSGLLRWNGTSWQSLCQIGSPCASDSSPDLAADSSGGLIAAWTTSTSSDDVLVSRWDGTTWTSYGGTTVANTPADSRAPVLAVDSVDRPWVMWLEEGVLVVYRWDGSAWATVGVPLGDPAELTRPYALELNSADEPIVAWAEGGSIFVARWDGASWVDVGAGSQGPGGVANSTTTQGFEMKLDSLGRPVIAYADRDANNEIQIYLVRFDGSAWVEVAGSATGRGISDTNGQSVGPSLALDANDRPIVGWLDRTVTSTAYIRRFDGTSWGPVSTGTASGGAIADDDLPSGSRGIEIDPRGRIYVLLENRLSPDPSTAELAVFDRTTWQMTGAPREDVSEISLDVAESGTAYVTWVAATGGIHVETWNGTDWQEIAGSATMRGVAPADGFLRDPDVAVARDGRVAVIYRYQDENSLNNRYAYMNVFDGISWGELDGSASGMGLGDHKRFANPRVDWADRDLFVFFSPFTGANVVKYGENGKGILADEDDSLTVDFAVFALSKDAKPAIFSERGALQYFEYDGVDWGGLGGSDTRDGITYRSSVDFFGPAMAFDGSGAPVVAWSQRIDESSDIYVRHWDGSAWAEINGPSASGNGVSNSLSGSGSAHLAARDALVCVAWSEAGERSAEAAMRCTVIR